ncbi:MAG TPA: ADOP family duplicated permease [Vicinamibacterales bacterium]|nr:ADOP family duplicated permease [Vicinamibacterales bacterium]
MTSPPRLARWMVSALVQEPMREFLLGDLDEQFADAIRDQGCRRARRQYWSQSLRSIAPARAIRRTPGAYRPAGRLDMSRIWMDLVVGIRTILRSPGYSGITLLTLALAVGANTLLFSIANPLVLRPLPIEDPDRLGWIMVSNPERGVERSPASLPDFLEWRRMTSFVSLAAYARPFGTLTGHGDAKRIQAAQATANLFDVWGLRPARGRLFQPGEDSAGRPRSGVLSYRFWQQEFQGDANAIGQMYLLDGKPLTIVGVLTPAIEIGNLSAIDIWTPLALDATVPRDRRTLVVVGRLASTASLVSADAELQTIVASQIREHAQTNAGWQAHVRSTKTVLASGDTWVILGLLGVIVVFVLLIACANLANLVLARLVARRKEQAVRLALGASRWQVIRPVLLESFVLSIAGGLLGLVLAHAGLRVIRAAATDVFLRTMVQIDGNVMIFTALLSLVTPLLFTLWPAVSTGRSVQSEILQGARMSAGRTTSRRRSLLIGSQVALAFALLVVSALVVQSMLHLRRVDLGFDVRALLTYKFDLPADRYPTPAAQAEFARVLETRLAHLPGVTGAGLTSLAPALDADVVRPLSNTLHDGVKAEERPWACWFDVSPGFFRAAGIRVLAGRGFGADDSANRQPVAVLNKMAAERYFDSVQNAVGRTVTIHDAERGDQSATIVGVVTDTRDSQVVRTSPQMYVPLDQWPLPAVTVFVRSDDPASRAQDVQSLMRTVDPMVAISELKTMSRIIDDELASSRIVNGLFVGFALLALTLAAAGLFGVISYSVGQRRRELGIRLALGASPAGIGRMIILEGLRIVGIGLVVGLILAVVLARASTSLLFGVTASDPPTFLGVAALILLVTLLAAWAPAARAMRVDPAGTLRAE